MDKILLLVSLFFPFTTVGALYSVQKSAGPRYASPGEVSERSQLVVSDVFANDL